MHRCSSRPKRGATACWADFEEAGDEDVYRKVKGDLGDKVDEKTLRTKMSEFLAQAKAQLADES